MSNLRDRGPDERAEMLNPPGRGHSIFRGRPIGRRGKWSGRGRGTSRPNAANPASSVGGQEEGTIPARLRPTHFLALPLNNHRRLMAKINTFQKGLFSKADGFHDNFTPESTPSPTLGKGKGVTRVKSSFVRGLDSSILIDPRRLHMTLGVMALEQDDCSVEIPTDRPETTISTLDQGPPNPSSIIMHLAEPPTTPLDHPTRKTVSTALSLLNSLKPRISEILDSDKGVKIPLEVMDVLNMEKMWMNKKGESSGAGGKKGVCRGGERSEDGSQNKSGPVHGGDIEGGKAIGAGVLYVAPEMKNEGVNMDFDKLIQVSDLVHNAFEAAGYLTDRRPLKLHCTILNTSHRKPRFRQPFSYSDVLASDALPLFCGNASGDSNSQSISMEEGSSLSNPEHELTVQEDNSSRSIQPDPSTSALKLNPSVKSSNVPLNPQGHSAMKNSPVSVNLGIFAVEEIQLWIMGSHGPNNEYVSCGGVLLE